MIERTWQDRHKIYERVKGLKRAYIDGNEVATDWIPEIYDGKCLRDGDRFVGFFKGEILVCTIPSNKYTLSWKFHDCDLDKREKLHDALAQRLDKYNDEDLFHPNGIISIVCVYGFSIQELFYIKRPTGLGEL